ncbi:hypothetical protein M0802_000827 [Mischocyttarus mexicanus]|nr:hypothetical protein M0802_000827 [Mischocyttarus mexicanus]
MADITGTVIVIASVNTSTLNRSVTLLLVHYHEKPQERESACRGLTIPWLLRTFTAVGSRKRRTRNNFGTRNELRIGYDVESFVGRGGLHFGSPGTLFVHRKFSSYYIRFNLQVYEVDNFATETGATPEPRPFFEDPESNITVQLGAQVYMHCRVQNLQTNLKVSWIRRRGEEYHLLTIGSEAYASDSRFSMVFEQPNNWRLLLRSATERDAGLYECQISAHPPLIRTVHLTIRSRRTLDTRIGTVKKVSCSSSGGGGGGGDGSGDGKIGLGNEEL